MDELTLKQLYYGCGVPNKQYLFVAYVRPNKVMWEKIAKAAEDGSTVIFIKPTKENIAKLKDIAIFTDWDGLILPYFVSVNTTINSEFEYRVEDLAGTTWKKPNGNSFKELIDVLVSKFSDIEVVMEGMLP